MRELLDTVQLEGPHPVHVFVRPRRLARGAPHGQIQHFRECVEYLSQTWGGSATPIVPLEPDGHIAEVYRSVLPGALIDGISGGSTAVLHGHAPLPADSNEGTPPDHLAQLAVAMLDYRSPESYEPVSWPRLADDDPWAHIYLTCLGTLPDLPDARLLEGGHLLGTLRFEDFIRLERPSATGGLSDLLDRLTSRSFSSPRQSSLWGLASGIRPSNSLMIESSVLPDPGLRARAAGPNLVVVCTPGNIADLALLWNLRAAHGESHGLPIGIPATALDAAALDTLNSSEHRSWVGWGTPDVTFVSASIDQETLRISIVEAGGQATATAAVEDVLELGSGAGRGRFETLSWTSGAALVVPLNDQLQREVVQKTGFNRGMGLMVDLSVLDTPIAAPRNARFDAINFHYIAGRFSTSTGTDQPRPDSVIWPSSMLNAQMVLSRRDLTLQPSEPGRACAVVCSAFDSIHELQFLAHAPLLALLESMAGSRGASLMKRRARELDLDPGPLIARSSEDLADRSANEFQRAIGNNTAATELWLQWAEQRRLLVKGFPLRCSECHSKQWIPVSGFRPPIVCSGCGREMQAPFGRRTHTQFTYRISERLRRVYEHDAIGHLLTMRFFAAILRHGEHGRLVGAYPGVELVGKRDGWATEVDLLLIDRAGDAQPVEIKRSFSGVTDAEAQKLDTVSARLRAPWSAFAVTDWGREAPLAYPARAIRVGRPGDRLALTYDHLLNRRASWTIDADPFEWTPSPATENDGRGDPFPNFVREWIDSPSHRFYERALLGEWPDP